MSSELTIRIKADTRIVAPMLFTVTDQDILEYVNELGWSERLRNADDEALTSLIKDVAGWKVVSGRASPNFDRSQFNVEIDPEQINKIRSMFKVTEGSKKKAANPAQQAATDAFKIVKKLQDLLTELAKLPNREEIAQAAGLTELPDAIDRLYELADRYRTGGVGPVGGPQEPGVPAAPAPAPAPEAQPEQQSYAGWDPEALRRHAKPFVDTQEKPIKVIPDPAEKYRFDRERETCPHCGPAPGLAEPN
jgi:hypothetical protein